MLSKEIKQLIELSGGKIIISEGDIADSYVVMKFEKHLEELKNDPQKEEPNTYLKVSEKEDSKESKTSKSGLTREELLDRINTDIAEMKRMNVEREIVESFESENEKDKDKKGEFYYEKVH